MKFHFHIPQVGGSTIKAGSSGSSPVRDGRMVTVPNRWNMPPHTVGVIGRPAVSFAFVFHIPRIALGFIHVEAHDKRWEQDIGGHLFIAITGGNASHVQIIEAGPSRADGSGALVPFRYPEDTFAEEGIVDFPPMTIVPPHGLDEAAFAELVRSTQPTYDGDQRYVAVQLPFLFVGRDSNSYAAGVLACAGVDPRAIPPLRGVSRYEWTGYPGLEDPVHLSSFGTYLGAPTTLDGGAAEIAYHNDDGSVRFIVVGGTPNGTATLRDGSVVTLDALGRIVFTPHEAKRRRLPTVQTDPPANVVHRRHYPADPSPAGGLVTLVRNGISVPFEPGTRYRGTIVDRNDALGIATMRTSTSDEIVLPIAELGVELRDPKRVDALFRVGIELTVGLRGDRHPRLVAHGDTYLTDRLTWRRLHAPPPPTMIVTGFALAAAIVLAAAVWRRRG